MAQLHVPFDAHKHEPWQSNWHHVANPYVYSTEPGDPVPVFPEPPIGLVGDVMGFIEAKAPHPMRYASVAGSLGFLAGIVGRAWNVEDSGLNIFAVLLSPSGSGKEMASKGPGILLNHIVRKISPAASFIGPGDVTSKAALHRYVSKTTPPSFVMFINEAGEWMEPIVSPTASEHRQSLRKMLLDCFEKGGKGSVLHKSAYADVEKNIETVERPAVSIVGDSTAATFYGAMNEKNTANGFFPRFIILENEERTAPFNEGHASVEPSAELIERLSDLCSQSLNLNNQGLIQDIAISKDARFELVDFRNRCAEERDASKEEHIRAIWSRGYIHALRVSGILAVGRNFFMPTIDVCDATWAVSLVTCSIEKLLNKFDDGEVGDVSKSEVARLNEVKRAIKRYLTSQWPEVASYSGSRSSGLHRENIVPYGFVQRSVSKLKPFKDAAFGKSSEAIKQTLRIMIERGELVEMSRAKMAKDYGYSGVAYGVERPEAFLE
ncbi:DUF3987 domain-containing protein [Pseudogemmobacter sonorensis]|uniref:DUF3987 domain-containing protein n=1 Tax=Pseudogemmobacter sonorensis TaxID=2989681 RepID=UPI0036799FC6